MEKTYPEKVIREMVLRLGYIQETCITLEEAKVEADKILDLMDQSIEPEYVERDVCGC